MANHLTPTELAREAGLERREVISKCMEMGVPIFQGRIDKTLFITSLQAEQPAGAGEAVAVRRQRARRRRAVVAPAAHLSGACGVLLLVFPVRRLLLVAVVLAAALLTAGPATAASLSAVQAKLTREMRAAGPSAGAVVRDLDSGGRSSPCAPTTSACRRRSRSSSSAPPRSCATAPRAGSPPARSAGAAPVDGVIAGPLYLVGGGDPTLSAARITELAAAVKAAGRHDGPGRRRRRRQRIRPSHRQPRQRLPLRQRAGRAAHRPRRQPRLGLQGPPERSRRERRTPPRARAQARGRRRVRDRRGRDGAPVGGGCRAGPVGAAERDRRGDERALRQLPGGDAPQAPGRGAWRGRDDRRRRGRGARPRSTTSACVRGSSTDRASRAATARPRVRSSGSCSGWRTCSSPQPFTASLPVAGVSGTLQRRMRGTAAAGNCRAKTGTLRYTSNLAGYCTTGDGGVVAFALLMNGVNVSSAHGIQDRIATALAGWDGTDAGPDVAPPSAPAPAAPETEAGGGAAAPGA